MEIDKPDKSSRTSVIDREAGGIEREEEESPEISLLLFQINFVFLPLSLTDTVFASCHLQTLSCHVNKPVLPPSLATGRPEMRLADRKQATERLTPYRRAFGKRLLC